MTNLHPLVDAEVDLRDFAFMPLDVVRLRDSDLSKLTTGDEFRCAVLLWCASWHQMPAGSLPDNDMVLADFAGFGRVVKEWLKIRDGAMRGWLLCTDGRLYHPVVAEKARDAWLGKLMQRWRTAMSAAKKHCERVEITYKAMPFEQWMELGRPEGPTLYCHWDKTIVSPGQAASVTGTDRGLSPGQGGLVTGLSPPKSLQGTGRGTGTGRLIEDQQLSSTADTGRPPLALVSAPAGPPPCPHELIVDAYHRILPTLPRVRKFTPKRRAHLAARWKEDPERQSLAFWEKVFRFVSESPFLMGQRPGRNGGVPFEFTIDFAISSEDNLIKILESRYHRDQA